MVVSALATSLRTSSWRERSSDWLSLHAGNIALILVVAIVTWVLGRLAIATIARGMRAGSAGRDRRAKRVLRRSSSTPYERSLEDRLAEKRGAVRSQTVSAVLRGVLTFTVVVLAIMMILSEVGLNVGPLIATAGIVGVALGFGAQSVVKDVLSGMFMLLEDQYGVGDIIDVGDASGVVESVGLRSTRLRSLNGTVWFFPNGEIRRVGNMSRLWSRAMIEVRVDYAEDVDKARKAILEAAQAAIAREDIAPSVIGEPTVPGVESLAPDAITLRLLLQVQPAKQWDVERAIRKEIQRVFRKRGIRMAVPENRIYGPDQMAREAAPLESGGADGVAPE